MSTSPVTAVRRSTCLVSPIVTAPAATTSSRSGTELLTAALNRLVAVTVIVSLTPTLAPPGTATRTSREAAPP